MVSMSPRFRALTAVLIPLLFAALDAGAQRAAGGSTTRGVPAPEDAAAEEAAPERRTPEEGAREEGDAADVTSSPAPGITLEEVIVYGNRTLDSLRQEVFRAEEAFYDAFNAVNSNDEFDISCTRRAPTGSRMLRRVCEARFVKDLNEDFAQAFLRGEPLPPINPMIMYKGGLLVEEMRTVAREDPLVLQALIRLAETKEKFEEERKRRCAGRILFCRR